MLYFESEMTYQNHKDQTRFNLSESTIRSLIKRFYNNVNQPIPKLDGISIGSLKRQQLRKILLKTVLTMINNRQLV